MSIYYIGCVTIYVLFSLLGLTVLFIQRRKDKQPQLLPNHTPLSYDELFEIINLTFEHEAKELFTDYRNRNVKVIPDMEADIRHLTIETIEHLSPRILTGVAEYHDEDYVIRYVTRRSRDLLIEYTDKNRPSTSRTMTSK